MKPTPFFITVVMIIALVYDFFAVVFGGVDHSISRFMQVIGFKAPMIVFACGFLAGHFWGYMELPTKEEK